MHIPWRKEFKDNLRNLKNFYWWDSLTGNKIRKIQKEESTFTLCMCVCTKVISCYVCVYEITKMVWRCYNRTKK